MPIAELTSKYEHASYVRPARFYIQTAGAATFTKIFTEVAPLRSFSARDRKPSRARRTNTILLERKSSDQSEPDLTPVTLNTLSDGGALDQPKTSTAGEKAMPQIEETLDDFDFTIPEHLHTSVVSRSRSHRKQRLEMHRFRGSKATSPSKQVTRTLSYAEDDVEERIDGLVHIDSFEFSEIPDTIQSGDEAAGGSSWGPLPTKTTINGDAVEEDVDRNEEVE